MQYGVCWNCLEISPFLLDLNLGGYWPGTAGSKLIVKLEFGNKPNKKECKTER